MDYHPIQRDVTSFQKPLSLAEIQRVCEHVFGALDKIITVTELSSGMFNNTYVITQLDNQCSILRVGPDASVYAFSNEKRLLHREHSIESYFKTIQDLIPQTQFVDFSGEVIPRDYVVQSFLEGQLWDEITDELSPAQTTILWGQLGEIAQTIHTVAGQKFGFPIPMPQFDTWTEAIIAIVSDMLTDLQILELDTSGVAEFIGLLERGQSFLNEVETPHLLHGDLWPKNVLVDDSRAKIVGLLDAERALWGDPEAEWIFHYFEVNPAFWKGYGQQFTPSFRTHTYLGLYSVQLFLEAWRFAYDDRFARNNLTKAMAEMQKLLR